MSHLRLSGVGRHFGHRQVLADIDLEVAPGDRVAVTGANGSGKTTLLRIAAGVLRPTAGHVERPRTAFVPQDSPVYAELTPGEHLRWWSRLHGTRPSPDALEAAGLGSMADEPAGHLSRGQRQRLAIVLALHAGVDVLVLDEPYAALDADGAAWLDEALRPSTVLFSSHDDAPARLDARIVRLGAP